jgi:alpha-ketoglutarate-dependent taurine dioxygenase
MSTTGVESLIEEVSKKTTKLSITVDVSDRVAGGYSGSFIEAIPKTTRERYQRHGIDLSNGYPERPPSGQIPLYIDDAAKIRDVEHEYVARGKNADKEKKALFSKVKEVKHLTKYIGTELVGVQLADLNEQELDELALLIAERVVVFFRDQDLSPQKQLEIGEFFGRPEVHPQVPHVPGLPGTTVIWNELARKNGLNVSFKNAKAGTGTWHSDLPHELQPPGVTHLHNDAIPSLGGDTLWASGYAAFDKLSPALQKFLEGKFAYQRSMHTYIDRENPLNGGKQILRRQPIVRTHPVTGWKSLYVNRDWTVSIEGLEPAESKAILEYLYDVYEKNLDIQVRFDWRPTDGRLGTSALWDNRVSQHCAVWDYAGEEPRHGTRVSSLAEIPFFDPDSKSQREALGQA